MKHFGRTIVFTLAACTLVVASGAAQTASGLSGLGLNVSPAKLELAMPPGTMSYPVSIYVQNSSVDATHIQASMVDFGVTPSGSYDFQRPGSTPYSLLRWAAINPREFDLPAGTTQQVRLSLSMPNAKEPPNGEYSGIVFFQTRPTRRAHAVSFSVRIATKIYVTIPGTVKIAGAIAKMTATGSSTGETYRVLFKNTGNAHTYLNGSLEVRKGGQTIERISLPNNQLVERGENRLIEVSGRSLAPGKYQAIALVDYGGSTMTGGEMEFEAKP
jgi:P pilus assembly chaperone PapD